ncbi:MAG: transposase, partial [bacterium]
MGRSGGDHGGWEERVDGVCGRGARRAGGPRSAALLERLDAATPWATLAAPIRSLPEYHAPGAGHPPWCPVLMLKCLMLQKWFNLSDPGLEESLKDRIS